MKNCEIQTSGTKWIPATEEGSLRFSIINENLISPLCEIAEQRVLFRLVSAVSEPILMNKIVRQTCDGNKYTAELLDDSGQYKASLRIEPEGDRFTCLLDGYGPEPIWLMEWKLSGLKLNKVIIPALGGQSVSGEMPEGTVLSYKYPFWLNAQFVVGQAGKGGLCISSEDDDPSMKLVRVQKENGCFSLSYGFENDALRHTKKFSARWYLNIFTGHWKSVVDRHRRWLEQSFNLQAYHQHASLPDWARRINIVLEIWGARRDTPQPGHTFAQMIDRIEEWQSLHDPRNTLLYLPAFAENGIDSHAPDYNPSPQCGGEEEFTRLVKRAHDLNYRVMLHTNVLAMTFTHRLYHAFKKYQVVDIFGRAQSWGLDMDGDWLAEPYFAYINPGYKAWGDLMVKVIGALIEKYEVDGIFLDQTLLAFNVATGPNFIKGMREHVQRLQQTYPHILFAGEGLHEQNVSRLPFAQIHGLDSIKDVHGQDDTQVWRSVHPVSTYLFNKYTRFTGHLLTRHPLHPDFGFQENAYKELNVIPVLALYDHQQMLDLPAVHKMIERAKEIKPN